MTRFLCWAMSLALLLGAGGGISTANGQTAGEVRQMALNAGLSSLSTVPVPDAPNFKQFVKDRSSLLILGKALFWEQQVGSDGQSCASCHFHAGADNRSKNQLNPGFRDTRPVQNPGDFTFEAPFGPNYQVTAADFPFHRVNDPAQPGDAPGNVAFDTNTVVSSQGVFNASFTAFGIPGDVGVLNNTDPVGLAFSAGGVLFRNVEPRNTPTVVNAVLNHRNFWDGRARNEFNGNNPIGSLDPTTRVVKAPGSQINVHGVFVQIRQANSSAASQADGPPLSNLEMSFAGRIFPQVGRKMLQPGLRALGQQIVDPTDSVLGPFSCFGQPVGPNCPNAPNGITKTYDELIKAAFDQQWTTLPGWIVDYTLCPNGGQAPHCPVLTPGTADGLNPGKKFSIMEYNFPLYFGMAVQEYEKKLISNQTRFDQFMEGADTLTQPELAGLVVFTGQGKCSRCHGGPELTNASITNVQQFEILERMIMGNDRIAVYDNGFYNIGVRPTAEDIGIGARIGPRNLPLSNSRFFQECVQNKVPSLQAANPLLTFDQVVRLANVQCQVPRILARPGEAAVLLTRIASAVGSTPALDLIAQAEALLALVPPDVPGAVALLLQAEVVLAAAGGDPVLLAEAQKLLPDPVDPGLDPLHPFGPPLGPAERVAVDGAHKVPGLRNALFTAPYFHNGGRSTFEQVVDFYNRGGDFPITNQENLDPDIRPLGLSDDQKAALVAFLEALSTDERVPLEKDPFDHPSLNVPNGGSTATGVTVTGITIQDDRVVVPPVGAAGNQVGYGGANTPFANFLQPLPLTP